MASMEKNQCISQPVPGTHFTSHYLKVKSLARIPGIDLCKEGQKRDIQKPQEILVG